MRGKVTMLAMVMLLLFSFFLFSGCGGVESEVVEPKSAYPEETVGEENAVAEPICLQETPLVEEIPAEETPCDETVVLEQVEPLEPIVVTSGFFQCAQLEIVVRKEINKLDGELTAADVEELTSLSASSDSIRSLSGLEYATNLKSLSLSDVGCMFPLTAEFIDLTPLSGLTKLTELSLAGNRFTSIAPLSSLTNLTSLTLWRYQITDLTPLSGLTSLTSLFLSYNQITDIAPLVELANLSQLSFLGNPLDFTYGSQDVANIEILQERGLTGQLRNIRLSPPSEIFRCANLEDVVREAINKPDGDLTAVDLEKLTSLTISPCSVVSFNGLEYAANLKTLNAEAEGFVFGFPGWIVDITPLSGLTNLTDLQLGGNQITDITPLSNLTSLTRLGLGVIKSLILLH